MKTPKLFKAGTTHMCDKLFTGQSPAESQEDTEFCKHCLRKGNKSPTFNLHNTYCHDKVSSNQDYRTW